MSSTISGKQKRRSAKNQVESKPQISIQLRCVRPALIDPRFKGDVWIVDQGNGVLALRLGDYSLTQFLGLPLDLPSLNQRLDQVWNRRPRKRPAAREG
jgi:hypothetical protein